MDLAVSTVPGQKSGSQNVSVTDAVFGVEFNEGLVHQIVVAYQAKARQGSKRQKNRSDVSGGGKKPWKQKGTGRARAGTTRGPLWRTGGVTFAARPRDFAQKVNKKMYRAALRSIYAELCRQDRLIVVDEFSVSAPKTKELLGKLKEMQLDNVLILTEALDFNLCLAARNLLDIDVQIVKNAAPTSLVGHDKVLITVAGLKQLEEKLA